MRYEQNLKTMLGKEINVKGKEHLVYAIVAYDEERVQVTYKSGNVRFGDCGDYHFKRSVFDASYDAEKNEIDPMNLADVEPTKAEQNEQIRAKREAEYLKHSDSLYMAWQKYLALGNETKAEEARLAWIAEVERIDSENPYIL